MFDVTSPFEEPAGETPGAALHRGMLPSRDRDLQRAKGAVRVVLAAREGVTYASDVFQKSPLRVLFPRVNGGAPGEAVLANTSGGVAGGDSYSFEIVAGGGSAMTVTTQAAEKIYGAIDAPAIIETILNAAAGARLSWLPQETILFDGARLHRTNNVELAARAELLALEWIVLGRAARGESMRRGEVVDSWRVRLGGRLIWADTLHIDGAGWDHLNRAALLDGCTALATLVYFGPEPGARLDAAREVLKPLPCRSGATHIGGLVIMRFAAPAPADLRLALRVFLQEFGSREESSPFNVPKMWSC